MTHFAQIDENNIVINVIVAEQDFIDSGVLGDPSTFIQTSYNTRGGVHFDPNTGLPDKNHPLRKNFAGLGYTYDKTRDAFIAPSPYPSWILDEDSCQWIPPVPYPGGTDKRLYEWIENEQAWQRTNWDLETNSWVTQPQ